MEEMNFRFRVGDRKFFRTGDGYFHYGTIVSRQLVCTENSDEQRFDESYNFTCGNSQEDGEYNYITVESIYETIAVFLLNLAQDYNDIKTFLESKINGTEPNINPDSTQGQSVQ